LTFRQVHCVGTTFFGFVNRSTVPVRSSIIKPFLAHSIINEALSFAFRNAPWVFPCRSGPGNPIWGHFIGEYRSSHCFTTYAYGFIHQLQAHSGGFCPMASVEEKVKECIVTQLGVNE